MKQIKMSNRKMAKIVMAVVVSVMTVCLFFNEKVASANNYTDSAYQFYFNAGQTSTYVSSRGREKMDTSKVYIMCNYAYEPYIEGEFKFTAQAHGSNSLSSGFYACTYNGKTTPSYVIKKGATQYMTNFVKEAEKKYANIYVKKNGVAATFKGNWSPDNYNKY